MLKELAKRPFSRPLLVWIGGILLHCLFPEAYLSVWVLAIPVFILGIVFCASRQPFTHFMYTGRWGWGAVWCSLLLSLSLQTTALVEQERGFSLPPGLERRAAEAQELLVSRYDALNLADDEKSVVATLTLGYRQAMNRGVSRSFTVAGVAHILSVSGFHVAIVCGFISLLLFFVPRWGAWRWAKYLLTLVLLWVFVGLSGLTAPAVRSGVMLSLFLTGRVLRRPTDSYNTLAAAAFCMLVYNPYYLFDIGFQLSYIALFFILYLDPKLNGCIVVKNPLLAVPWSWTTMTLSAQVGTTLLCLYYFGQVSTLFLLTHLPLTLLSTLLIPLALLWLLLPDGLPGVGLLQQSVEWLTRQMLHLVESFSQLPGALFTFRFGFIHLLAGYALLFFLLMYLRSYRSKWLFFFLSLVLIILLLELLLRQIFPNF